ncbi:MAG: DUF898 family protein [Rhodospirillales bacterium]|nr:DUF898 family protein [Rhodospirillales bacterium]
MNDSKKDDVSSLEKETNFENTKSESQNEFWENMAEGIELEDEPPLSEHTHKKDHYTASANSEPQHAGAIRHRARGDKRKRNLLIYDGATGEIYRIWLTNLFLNIITFGVYSFWGRTRLRVYVMGCLSLDRDRFFYLGRGIELFVGFLKGLPILAVLFSPVILSIWFEDRLGYALSLFILSFVSLPVLKHLVTFGAFRYRVRRLSWRGIRGAMFGSLFAYSWLAFKRFLANILSFGLLIPESDLRKHEYIVNYTFFGDIPLVFDRRMVQKRPLHSAHNKIYRVIFLYFLFNTLSFAFEFAGFHNSSAWVFFLTSILFMPFMTSARIWYAAALMRAKMQGIVAGPLRFEFEVGDKEMAKYVFGNLVIMIVTLGLGTPIVLHRKMRFFANHLVILGPLGETLLRQAHADKAETTSEGLASVLDSDIGVFG